MDIKIRAAGDLIDSQCTKCKILTNHTIVAMAAGKPARVKCNTCGGEHNYRPPKGDKAPTTRRSPSAKVSKASGPSHLEQWNAALARLDVTKAQAYEMDGKYIKNMLITHLTFGMGVVTSLSFGKMEVLFNEGPRWLGCR
jgi:hypothetical protein